MRLRDHIKRILCNTTMFAKNVSTAKASHNFSAKYNPAIVFVGTVRLNKPSTNDFIKFTML